MTNLIVYKKIKPGLLIPSSVKQQFEGGLIPAITKARNGEAIRDLILTGEAESFQHDGRNVTISDPNQKRRALIGGALVGIGRRFGATGQIPSDIMKGLVDFIQQHFSFLSLEEISLAFNLAASGQLKADCSLYGKPINLDWLSRVLRAYRLKRSGALTVILQAEVEFQKVVEIDEATESARRNSLNLDILEGIADQFVFWKEGGNVSLSVYHWQFLEKIGSVSASKLSKKNAFKRAKKTILEQLFREKEATATTIGRQAIEGRIAAIKEGADQKNGRQAKEAVCRLFRAFFWWLTRKGIDPETFSGEILERYADQQEELCQVHFLVTLTSFAGGQRQTKPLDRKSLEELIEKIDGKITSIKIELK